MTNPGIENWKDIVPHDTERYIQNMKLFKNYMVALERVNGLEQIQIIKKLDKSVHYINFDDENYYVTLRSNSDYESNKLNYTYSALKTPQSVIEYDLQTGEKSTISQAQVLGYNPNDYISERIWATASDGRSIPISMVYKRGIKRDGSNPMVLYAYGSYGNTSTSRPAFNTNHLPLLNRGFIYAIAHVRGGGYLGREWYEEGRLLNKRNTFTDYITCAEHLISEKYTSSNTLIAKGLSAGGLLMGAIANMKPAIFKGVIANVPFVDVVTNQLDETIPLAAVEYQEWGNSNIKEEYEYMLTYSPYDNVTAQDYPHLLVTTGYHDSQVQYFEPAKWVAKLRSVKTDSNILLFTTNMSGGHSGGAGRYDNLHDLAFEYAFIFKILEKKP
jgi:oligopeptidase B